MIEVNDHRRLYCSFCNKSSAARTSATSALPRAWRSLKVLMLRKSNTTLGLWRRRDYPTIGRPRAAADLLQRRAAPGA